MKIFSNAWPKRVSASRPNFHPRAWLTFFWQTSRNCNRPEMDLTNPQRVAKLAGDLVQHPGNVPRYIAHNLISRKPPVELELPWFSYGAIEFLENYLQNETRVFEFGSGGSTLFFAQRAQSVVAVEDNAHWCELVA